MVIQFIIVKIEEFEVLLVFIVVKKNQGFDFYSASKVFRSYHISFGDKSCEIMTN